MNIFKKFQLIFLDAILDDEKRYRLQFFGSYILLGIISFVFSVINIITQEYVVMIATLVFAVLSVLNIVLLKLGEITYQISTWLFSIEMIVLFMFFIYTGSPEGFSVLWSLMLPSLGLFLLGIKRGGITNLIMFCVLAFSFWTPTGKDLLPTIEKTYDSITVTECVYTTTFCTRFPVLYIAFFALGALLEVVRLQTFNNFKYSYTHDALTGALNRVGYVEYEKNNVHNEYDDYIYVMFDIDHFKKVNDSYGHLAGDEVLKFVSDTVSKLLKVPVCRWGGEEFIAVFPRYHAGVDDLNHVLKVIEESPIYVGDKVISITISIGAALLPEKVRISPDGIIKIIDGCLYQAKESGRNRLVFKEIEINVK